MGNNFIKMEIPANTRYIEVVRLSIRNLAKILPFSSKELNRIELVIDEAVTNIIEHSYNFDSNQNLTLNAWIEDNCITIEFFDKGIEFKIGDVKEVDLTEHLAKRKSSGLGVYIIKRNMDVFEYERRGDTNYTKLIKTIK